MLKIQHIIPSPGLQPYVSAFYQYESTGAQIVEDHLLSEAGSLVFRVSGSWRSDDASTISHSNGIIVGPHDRPMKLYVSGEVKVFGISLSPLGWLYLLGPTAEAMANKIVDLHQLLPFGARRLQREMDANMSLATCIEIISAFLEVSCAQSSCPRLAGLVEHIDAQLHAQPIIKVAALADAMEMSPRHLERVMPCAFGFSPKTILRQRRFLRSLLSLTGTQDCYSDDFGLEEFHDQSHMIREYRLFSGLTPKRYRQYFTAIGAAARPIISPSYAWLLASLHPTPHQPSVQCADMGVATAA